MFSELFLNPADIVLVIIVIAFAVIGLRCGFVKMGFRIFSFLAAIVLARLLYPILSEYLQTTSVYENLLGKISGGSIVNSQISSGFLTDIIKQGETVISGAVAAYIAQLILNIVSFVLVLILVKLILVIAEKALHLFTSLPVIGLFNRLAGLALGICEGILIVCVLLAVIYAAAPIRDNPIIGKAVSEHGITQAVYNNNPLIKLVLPDTQEQQPDND